MELEGVVEIMGYQIKSLEGRPHYVVPVVMIVEGVLNGSHGGLFYPASMLRRTAAAWNGRPIVVTHPGAEHKGQAGNPETFNSQKVGFVFRARTSGDRLVGEAWLDKSKVDSVEPRLAKAIVAGRMVEVSTGLYTATDGRAGVHNGRTYQASVTDCIPDHLAILMDQPGACDCKSGCGLARNSRSEELIEELALPSTA
jgi:hypothetical protein